MTEIIVTSKNFISASINFQTCSICAQDYTRERTVFRISIWGWGRESRPEAGMGLLGPSGVRGRAPTDKWFYHILSTQDTFT